MPEDALRLGLAAARFFGGPILTGRYTRLSGRMLSAALASGAASGGAGVVDVGVLPTPGIAALAREHGAAAAVVVSASHNPYPDNGLKFFSSEGRKLPYSAERKLERLVGEPYTTRPTGGGIGTVSRLDRPAERYAESVLECLRPCAGGVKVLLDCAHGAAYEVAPLALRELGVELTVVGDEPSGININEGVGSTHVKKLDAAGHDVAFAFDGDADRVLAVDEKGSVVDGDGIVAILARDLKGRGALKGGVVVTVMSNLGFFKAMEGLRIDYEVTPVGDGLVAAFAILDVMARSGKSLSELAEVMEHYPQALISVPVEDRVVASSRTVKEAVVKAEERLGSEGRILLRPSGTEPLVRVMVEHEEEAVCREVCEGVAAVVSTGAGSKSVVTSPGVPGVRAS